MTRRGEEEIGLSLEKARGGGTLERRNLRDKRKDSFWDELGPYASKTANRRRKQGGTKAEEEKWVRSREIVDGEDRKPIIGERGAGSPGQLYVPRGAQKR